jgi:hypothetical protein
MRSEQCPDLAALRVEEMAVWLIKTSKPAAEVVVSLVSSAAPSRLAMNLSSVAVAAAPVVDRAVLISHTVEPAAAKMESLALTKIRAPAAHKTQATCNW